MNLSKLAQEVQNALSKVIHKYEKKKEQLEPILLTFEKNQNFTDFVEELYRHELILKDDVKELLEQLGKNSSFVMQVGNEFYLLWLESEIMDFGKISEKRLGIKELADFPLTRPEQLSFLESILTAYSPSIVQSDIESKFLRTIQTKPLFNEFLKTLKMKKDTPLLSSSRLMKQSQVKEISLLKGFDKPKYTFKLIQKIVDKIGKVSDIKDPRQRLSKVQDFINQLLEKDSSECELLSDLQQVILNIINIDIRKNCCFVKEKSQDVILESFKTFSKFYENLWNLMEVEQKKKSIEDFLKMFEKNLKDDKTAWLWPTCSQSSFIVMLRDTCIKDSNDIIQLNELLWKYAPNIQATVWTYQKRQFLFEAIFRTPDTLEKGTYLKMLLKIARKQQLDIQKHFSGGKSYFRLFLDLGIPMKMLEQMESFVDQEHDCFMINDKKTNKKQFIFLSREHVTELLEKFTNKQIEKGTIDSALYHLTYIITDKFVEGTYQGLQQNIYNYGKTYQGPLFYSNLAEFESKLKDFEWKVFSTQQKKIITLSPEENQTIGSQIYRIIKNKEEVTTFTITTAPNKEVLEINAQNLEVKLISEMSRDNPSKIKQKIGTLLYIPKFKGKKQVAYMEIEQFEEVGPSLEEDYPLDMKNKVNKETPSRNVSQDQHEEESEEIFYQSKKTFPFLGVFKQFFDLQNNYHIDSKKNVLVSELDRKVLQYFERFQFETMFGFMDKFLQPSIPQKKPPIQFGSPYFSLSQKGKILADKKFENLSRKYYGKKAICKYNSERKQIQLQNIQPNKQAFKFFSAFFNYVTLLSQQEDLKKNFVLKVNNEQAKYIEQSRLPGVKVKGRRNSRIEIEATPQMKQKLQKDIQFLDEVKQFILDNYQAFQLMKTQEKEYLLERNVVEKEKIENFFKISLKLKYYPQFMKKYSRYCEMIAQQPGQSRQQLLPNQSDFLHIYQAEFAKEDPQILVTRMPPDILIEYNSKKEKKIQEILKKIQELKQKQRDSISQKSSKEFIVKGINVEILFKLKNSLQKMINAKSKNKIEARINLDKQSPDEFKIFATQVNKEQQDLLPILIKNFEQSFKAYKRIKYEINDTQKFLNQVFAKIPDPGAKAKIKKYLFTFRTKLRSVVLEIIQNTTKKYLEELEKSFLAFLDQNNLNAGFNSDLSEKSGKEIEDQIDKMNIFARFLSDQIDEAEKQSKVKNPALRGVIIKQTQQIVKTAESAFKASKLQYSILRRFFKSAKILITIYYGPQLPITPHLQEMRQKLENNDVVMVKVGTGSGKSTVIPPYLVGLGYKKVVVTQPRRLPCRQIYKRITQVFGDGVGGYHVGDGFLDKFNSLVYMTDGLIKMQAIYDESVLDKIDVLVIDEIHERSANIDLLLLVLYCYFKQQKRKLKLILCSATIDKQIGDIMKDANLKVDTFEPQIPSKYKVTEYPITQGTILEKIVELSKKMKNDEQLLAFFPGVADVHNGVSTLLEKYNVQAYAITANQPHKEQQDIIQNGKIFISTALAETSLTFRNLKYVIDSRLSRWRSFDPDFEMMRTDEDYSSNSSIQQRKGRVGRNCDGEYYYFVYQDYDFSNNREHNPTELEKNDFTNYIFQMLLKGQSRFQEVESLFRKLKHTNKAEFDKKMRHSEEILYDNNILQQNGSLAKNAMKFLKYGNLGNPQHNIALFQASSAGCFLNMAYLVAFQMFGVVAMDSIIKFCKLQYKSGGDLRAVHDFLIFVGSKIDISNIKENEVYDQMKIQHKALMSHGWFNLIVKIMTRVSQLIKRNTNNIPAPVSQWDDILNIFKICYSNKIFFNQSLFGGNKREYEKIRKNEQFNFDQKKIDNRQESKVTFILNKESLTFSGTPGVILSLYSSISPLSESVLSLCEAINVKSVTSELTIVIKGSEECDESFLEDGTKLIDERTAFDEIHFDIRSKYHRVGQKYNFPEIKIVGGFNDLVESFETVIEPKRKNDDVTIELKKILNQEADNYAERMKHAMTPIIPKEKSQIMLEKLTHEDYKQLFNSMVNDYKANYGVGIRWDEKKGTFKVEKAKNIVLSKIIKQLTCFMSWFCQCQLITKDQYKIKPEYVGDFKNVKPELIQRINSIVNSRLQHYILKGWCNGKGPGTKEPRTARMIAVCWVLVNRFDCVIKGGFVRDWVVNGEEVLPKTEKERVDLLQNNPRNQFLEVVDDTVTPSDIDAEMSSDTPFIEGLFLKEMKKLGISVRIEEDGWRKHIMFDYKSPSGGFTADLIQPFTSMTHYTYDFDVNVMYLKKNRLSSIGMKIPLVYQYSNKYGQEKVTLENLINNCINKRMTALKNFIPQYRFEKFKKRNWTINADPNLQPVCYKSLETQSFPLDPKDIDKICPIFYEKMVRGKNCRIIRIESLKNKGWDDAFAATENWIITQLQREARGKQPLNSINSNNKLLFHGTKTQDAANSIKYAGFDSRYFAKGGYYGRGAYFAEDPCKSHDYTGAPNRKMFIANVALGKQEHLTKADNNKTGPNIGFHSILGTAGSAKEYIIDRMGQAKLLYLITYQG